MTTSHLPVRPSQLQVRHLPVRPCTSRHCCQRSRASAAGSVASREAARGNTTLLFSQLHVCILGGDEAGLSADNIEAQFSRLPDRLLLLAKFMPGFHVARLPAGERSRPVSGACPQTACSHPSSPSARRVASSLSEDPKSSACSCCLICWAPLMRPLSGS